jgi:hypothetical protein
MTLVGRGILWRLLRLHGSLVLLGHVTADQAAGSGAEETVAAGIVTGNTADDRSLDAAFGISRDCHRRKGQRQCQSSDQCFHVGRLRPLRQSAQAIFVPPRMWGEPATNQDTADFL